MAIRFGSQVLSAGADPNLGTSSEFDTPLRCALSRGCVRAACALLRHGASLEAAAAPTTPTTPKGAVGSATTSSNQDVLTIACSHLPPRSDSTRLVRELLQAGASPNGNYPNADGVPCPLVLACFSLGSCHPVLEAVVTAMVQAGAVVQGTGALVAASSTGCVAVVDLVLQQGVDPCEAVATGPVMPGDRSGPQWTANALTSAVQGGHVDVALRLLDAGFSLTSVMPVTAYV